MFPQLLEIKSIIGQNNNDPQLNTIPTSTAASNVKSTGIGAPSVGVIIPAFSRAL